MSNVHKRGFASMSPERRKELATKGGHAVPGHKRSFATNKALAVEAGRQGGLSTKRARKGGRPKGTDQ